MLETGDFIDINLGGVPALREAGRHLLAPGGVDRGARRRARANQIWTYRVPSLLGALAAVAATFFLVRAVCRRRDGVRRGPASRPERAPDVRGQDRQDRRGPRRAASSSRRPCLMRIYLSVRSPDDRRAADARLLLLGWAAFALGHPHQGAGHRCSSAARPSSPSRSWDRDWRWLSRLHALTRLRRLPLLIVAPWAIAIGIASRRRSSINSRSARISRPS